MFAPLLLAAATTQEHYTLDPHAGIWLHGPNLPEARQDAASAVEGGRIFIIGGFDSDARSTNTTYVLEPVSGTNMSPSPDEPPPATVPLGSWSTAKPIPEPVDHAAAAALDGFVYVAGGRIENLVTNKFWRYDPADDSWVELPSLPVPRYGPTMQAADGKLYLIGGTSSHGHDEKSIEVYDPVKADWSLIEDAIGVDREASSTTIFQDRIALVGGRDSDEHNLRLCDLYSPKTGGWRPCSNMHLGRSGFGLAAVGDRLFAIGGVDLLSGLATQTMEISGPGGSGWMDGLWLPAPRQGMSVVVLGHTVWVIGGTHWDATAPTNSVLRYVIPFVKVKFGGRAPQ